MQELIIMKILLLFILQKIDKKPIFTTIIPNKGSKITHSVK